MVKSFPPLFSGKMMRMNRLSERNPTQKPIEACPRKSQDRRTVSAWEIYEMFQQGHIEVFKTTRAGATTSLNAESGNRDEKFTCIVPTNKIADETIVRDSINFCEKQGLDVIHIQSNMNCIKNQELCEEYPDLKELQYLPLADKCEDCEHYDYCPITAPLRRPNANGFVLTYAKVAALQLAVMSREGTTAEKILNSIAGSRNIILDEVHELQYGRQQEYIVYDNKNGYRTDFNKYNSACQDFEYIKNVIEQMKAIAEDDTFKIKVHEVLGGAESPKYWNHRLSLDYSNPAFKGQERAAIGKETAGFIKELIELTKNRRDYNLSMEDIKALLEFNAIGKSLKLSINAIKDNGIINIKVSALDFLYVDTIRNFTISMQGEGRRIILTTATFCSKDYSDFFIGKVSPLRITFGRQGDPTNNNEKMLILADNKKYNAIGDRSRYKMRPEIISRCIDILESYEGEEVLIIALSEREARSIEKGLKEAGKPHPVIYYKGSDTIGVTAKARIMIAIGIANKPLNAFDSITETVDESKKLLYESVHCDTWQAWSRVKDPNGKNPSVVFALGCCIDDVRACVKWGFNRQITGIEEHRNGCRNKLTIEYEGSGITQPKIIHCKNFEEMVTHAGNHRQLSKKVFLNSKNRLCNIIDGFSDFESKVYTVNEEFIKLIINREDLYKLYNPVTTRYFDVKKSISSKDIKDHLSGKMTIGGYQIDNNTNLVKWLCFDVDAHPKPEATKAEIKACIEEAEKQKGQLEEFLNKLNIPFVLELSGREHSYHFWIFLKPVDASAAYAFGRDIIRELGYKPNTDIEVFPKQEHINPDEFGNFVKLPLGIKSGQKSKIMQGGKFLRKISNLEIKFIDIAGYKAYVDEAKEARKKAARATENPTVNTVSIGEYKVKPCVLTASKMLLHGKGDAGNFTRVFIARELISAGMQPGDICKFFETQPDYNKEKTLYHIGQIMKKDYPPIPCHTVYEKVNNFIGCEDCPNFWKCGVY